MQIAGDPALRDVARRRQLDRRFAALLRSGNLAAVCAAADECAAAYDASAAAVPTTPAGAIVKLQEAIRVYRAEAQSAAVYPEECRDDDPGFVALRAACRAIRRSDPNAARLVRAAYAACCEVRENDSASLVNLDAVLRWAIRPHVTR